MQWNLRLKAAERGIWKSAEMRRRLTDAGLELSAGKMSALWAGTPTTIRLDDLDVICAVLECDPAALLIREPEKVAARRPRRPETATSEGASPRVAPRCGRPKSEPPLCPAHRRAATRVRPAGSRGFDRGSTSVTTACRAGRSPRPPAANAPPRTVTSARDCAIGAIPARRCTWARVGTAWLGECIEGTAGGAPAAGGGAPTTRWATANTAAATPVSGCSRRAGCASNRPAASKNRAGLWTFPAPTSTASSSSSPTCASNGPARPGSDLRADGPDGHQPGSVLSPGARSRCSTWTPTRR